MRRLIIFLIRKRLGVKKGEYFRFTNQDDKGDWYYFTDDALMKKINPFVDLYGHADANINLNWILDIDCEVTRFKFEDIALSAQVARERKDHV